jgi:hypothetical protein
MSNTLKRLRDCTPLPVVVGIGALLLAACGGSGGSNQESASPTDKSTVATASPSTSSEAPKQIKKIELPLVSNKGLFVSSVAEAKVLGENTSRSQISPLETLVEAIKGDSSYLDAMHIDINEIALNYKLNALYLKQASAGNLIDYAKGEQPADPYPYDLTSVTSNFDYAQASQYLLGVLITQYKAGKQPLLDTVYDQCAYADSANAKETSLPSGQKGFGAYPPLGIASISAESFCETNSSEMVINFGTFSQSANDSIKYANKMSLPHIAKLTKIESDISNFKDGKALTYLEQFKANIG